MEGLNLEDAVSGVDKKSDTAGGDRTSRPSVDTPAEGVVELIVSLFEDNPDVTGLEFPAFREVAEEQGRVIPEEVQDELDLPDNVETFSWEDFFQLDLSDYQYVGYPPRDREGEGVSYEEGWDLSDFTGDLTGATKRVLNGHFADTIQERLFDATADEPAGQIAIRVGRESDHGDDFEEAHKYQRFYLQDSDTAPLQVLKARRDVGVLTESEFDELASANGYVQNEDGRWVTGD